MRRRHHHLAAGDEVGVPAHGLAGQPAAELLAGVEATVVAVALGAVGAAHRQHRLGRLVPARVRAHDIAERDRRSGGRGADLAVAGAPPPTGPAGARLNARSPARSSSTRVASNAPARSWRERDLQRGVADVAEIEEAVELGAADRRWQRRLDHRIAHVVDDARRRVGDAREAVPVDGFVVGDDPVGRVVVAQRAVREGVDQPLLHGVRPGQHPGDHVDPGRAQRQRDGTRRRALVDAAPADVDAEDRAVVEAGGDPRLAPARHEPHAWGRARSRRCRGPPRSHVRRPIAGRSTFNLAAVVGSAVDGPAGPQLGQADSAGDGRQVLVEDLEPVLDLGQRAEVDVPAELGQQGGEAARVGRHVQRVERGVGVPADHDVGQRGRRARRGRRGRRGRPADRATLS